jgi:hypothetical protein
MRTARKLGMSPTYETSQAASAQAWLFARLRGANPRVMMFGLPEPRTLN